MQGIKIRMEDKSENKGMKAKAFYEQDIPTGKRSTQSLRHVLCISLSHILGKGTDSYRSSRENRPLPVLSHFILMTLRSMCYYFRFIREITEAWKSE